MTKKFGISKKMHYLCKRKKKASTTLVAKNEDGTPAITPREAQEALNGFTDDELQDGILWNSPEDVASIILEG